MPTYEYACRSCEEHFEVVQSFKDDPLTQCPSCAGELRKVFSAAGIIFKGSGWHIKDYANSSRSSAGSDTSKGEGSSDSKSTDKSDSKSTDKSDKKASSDSSSSGTSSTSSSSSSSRDRKSA